MSLEERAREAARRAQGAVQMIEVPESETVVTRRRTQHRTRAALMSGVLAMALVVGAAAIAPAIANNGKHPHVAVAPAQSSLEFRPVYAQSACLTGAQSHGRPAAGGFGVSVNGSSLPADSQVLANRDHTTCYAVGDALLTVSHFNKIEVDQDQNDTQHWNLAITFDNDDFVTKVAQPNVNKQIAMVVDGVVESAPTINLGISGRSVTVTGGFTKEEAVALAARLLAVGQSKVIAVPAPAPPAGAAGFVINGCPEPCDQAGDQATAADVVSATPRNDGKAGWVVDVKLTPAATARFAHDTMGLGVLDGQPISVDHVGDTFTLSSTQTVWEQATATQIAGKIHS